MNKKLIIKCSYLYEEASVILEVYNLTKQEINKLWNTYNKKYSQGKVEGGFEDFLDNNNIEYKQFEFDLKLED